MRRGHHARLSDVAANSNRRLAGFRDGLEREFSVSGITLNSVRASPSPIFAPPVAIRLALILPSGGALTVAGAMDRAADDGMLAADFADAAPPDSPPADPPRAMSSTPSK